jgi:hypothetical protein
MALPDVLIEIPEPRSQVRARDLPACVFFQGFADDVPFTDCWRAADWNRQHEVGLGMERWITGLLTRAVVEPILTPELVHRLGPSRDVLARAYLETVGWLPRNPDAAPIPVVVAPMGRKKKPTPDIAALVSIPGRNLHGILKQMATRTRTLPATLWSLPISEWIFNLRTLADPQPDSEDAMRVLGLDA